MIENDSYWPAWNTHELDPPSIPSRVVIVLTNLDIFLYTRDIYSGRFVGSVSATKKKKKKKKERPSEFPLARKIRGCSIQQYYLTGFRKYCTTLFPSPSSRAIITQSKVSHSVYVSSSIYLGKHVHTHVQMRVTWKKNTMNRF